MHKINIPGTTITLEVHDKEIEVKNEIEYDIELTFRNEAAGASLDIEGNIFEPLFVTDVTAKPKEPIEFYSSSGARAGKQQAIATVLNEFKKQVKDDEADAILIGSYFVNFGKEFGELENHRN